MPSDAVLRATSELQSALDLAGLNGGGEVVVPPGVTTVGTLELRSSTTLVVPAGSTLRGSTDVASYPARRPQLRSYSDNYTSRSVLYAESAAHVRVVGGGRIDGQGSAFLGRPYHERPYLLRFVDCESVTVQGVTLADSAMWTQHYLGCTRVLLSGVTVSCRQNINNDGVDIDSCTDVLITGCHFDTEDDAVCIKSTTERPCRQVVVTACTMSTDCNGFKIGTETIGNISDIVVHGCVMGEVGLAAVAIESVDGAVVERVTVDGISVRRAGAGVFVRLGHRGRPLSAIGTADDYEGEGSIPRNPAGTVRNIAIRNLTVGSCDEIGSSVTGAPYARVRDVHLQNVSMSVHSRAPQLVGSPPELLDKYPEYRMFGLLPAYGLFARHVDGLVLDRFSVTPAADEPRALLAFEDVHQLRDLNRGATTEGEG